MQSPEIYHAENNQADTGQPQLSVKRALGGMKKGDERKVFEIGGQGLAGIRLWQDPSYE